MAMPFSLLKHMDLQASSLVAMRSVFKLNQALLGQTSHSWLHLLRRHRRGSPPGQP